MTTFNVSMQQRADIASNWDSENPVLRLGEIGFEVDTGRIKIGDGERNWNETAYMVSHYNVRTFGAKADGITDDTAAIQSCINAAAHAGVCDVFFPTGHYIVTTIYDHYDATNNPGFPQGTHLNGRMRLTGQGAVDLPALRAINSRRGTLIETISPTGPAILFGNGNGSDGSTARRPHLKHMAIMGACTGSVVELSGAAQHTQLVDLTIFNDEGVGGKGLYIRNGFYLCTVLDVHIQSSDGDGLVCEQTGGSVFISVNVTNCGGTAWVLGQPAPNANEVLMGTGNSFINCQGRNSLNGLEIMGGRANIFSGWWLEQNTGDFDLKIHEGASRTIFQGFNITSTELNVASVIVGGNSGVSYRDQCLGIKLSYTNFNFVGGAVSNVAGILKRGTCRDLTLECCSFKNNGGKAIKIDTTAGVTPTDLVNVDFQPFESETPFGNAAMVVDENNDRAEHLVRGAINGSQINVDLDMSDWTHLPDRLNVVPQGGGTTITLPSDLHFHAGQTIYIRKVIAANTVTISGDFGNGVTSVTLEDDEETLILQSVGGSLFKEISTQTRIKAQPAPADPSGGATVDAEARAAVESLIDLLQSSGVLT
jgi:hypothetical protein